MRLRVVIADDEPLNRQRMRQFLEQERLTEIVAECTTGQETLLAIRQTSPDLVFLDVKMPELDGFGVLRELNGARLPVVVFVTAYDQFAVRAFEFHAVDYLLKPFDRARFLTAFGRAVERLRAISLDRSGTPSGGGPSRIAIKSDGRISLISATEIDWVCAADNYVELHVAKSSYFLRGTLQKFETQFPKNQFLRISRSHLVNLERIREVRPKSHGDALLILQDGTELPVSRNFRRNLLDPFVSS